MREIIGIVLAAGASRRFGGQKLVRPLAGEPLVRRAVRSVIDAGLPAVVVTRPADLAIRSALEGLAVTFAENGEAAEGMASSIRAGVAALGARVAAVVIVPGDQPYTPAGVIPALCDVFRATSALAVAPVYQGEQGPPVLFSASLFSALTELRGDRGARGVLEANRAGVEWVPVDEPMPRDVDSMADHAALDGSVEPPV